MRVAPFFGKISNYGKSWMLISPPSKFTKIHKFHPDSMMGIGGTRWLPGVNLPVKPQAHVLLTTKMRYRYR